jgi:hypothetical protein
LGPPGMGPRGLGPQCWGPPPPPRQVAPASGPLLVSPDKSPLSSSLQLVTQKTIVHWLMKGYLLTLDIGRLGNQLSQYATLYALAKIYQVPTAISDKMTKMLVDLFPDISIPTYNSSECSVVKTSCHKNYDILSSRSLTEFEQKIMSNCPTNVYLGS